MWPLPLLPQQVRSPKPWLLPREAYFTIQVSDLLHLSVENRGLRFCTLGTKEDGKCFLESVLVRWDLQCGDCPCEESIHTVPTTEGFVDVMGLELDLEGEKDLIREVKKEIFLSAKGTWGKWQNAQE